jgi:ABC-type uncharacterized transport system involved in gliding motility auxiliary subunit
VKKFLGLLGWIGVALVVAAVIIRFSKPEYAQWSPRLALAGLVVTALYTATQWRDIARSFSGRGVRYGSISLASVLLMLAILVGINYVAKRQNKRWDLTVGGQFSLSDQTKQLVATLQKPLTIQAFYVQNAGDLRDRLNDYTYLSKQVTVEYVDAERNPIEAQKAEIQTVPTLLVKYDGRTERANSADEQSVANAMKKVIAGRAKKVYFLQGHGEHDLAGSDPRGYSGIADALKTDNFETAKLTLAQTGSIPDDATVLAIAGPTADVLPAELDAIHAFLKKGGKVLLLLDPPDKGAGPEPTSLIALARDWGIAVGTDIVVDASGRGQRLGTDASVPIATPLPHAITNDFKYFTAMPFARSVTPVDGGSNGHTAQKFLETSPQSWAESDMKGLFATGRPELDPAKGDKTGPIAVAAAVSAAVTADTSTPATPNAPKAETRVVVVGDSDFAGNGAIGLPGNREIFLNIANWLAQQEDLIAIRPKDKNDRPITMTADQGATVAWFTGIIIPGLLLLNGVRVWWRKR